ncbi:MAG: TonB-dependent receptor plug domain-containing protein [Allosphingosinicella sp.]
MLHFACALAAVGAPPPHVAPPPRQEAARPKGDEDDDDEEEEGRVQPGSPITVTARRLDAARTAIDAALGASTYALTNDAVENRSGGETGSLADILAQAPGVTGPGLVVRGSRATQMRVNDVIVPEAVSDPAERISARLAETTRLMTGTLPAQFGFAPGGVVSVTTKSGLYQHGGQAELFAGSDGMIEPALEWSGSLAGTSLFASGSFERDRTVVGAADGSEARDARQALGGLAFADHVVDSHNRLSLILGGSRERHRIGATALGPGTERSRDGYAVATVQHNDDGFNLQASLFAGLGSESAEFASASRERRTSVGTQIDAARPLGGRNILRFGLLAARSTAGERGPAGRGASARRAAAAVYLQDEWTIAPTLTLNPGVRVEWLRGFSSRAALEPRFSLVWAPDEDFSAHAGYARYASAPRLRDPGGAALPEEKDDYLDIGAQRKLGPLTLGIDAYRRAVRNLLSERATPGSALAAPFAFRRATIKGVELSATYAHRGSTAWANLAFSRSTARSIVGGEGLFSPAIVTASSARPLFLADGRPLAASGGFTHRFDELTLSADLQISSGAVRTLDPARPNGAHASPYALVGVAAVYHLRLGGRPTDLRIDGLNLANVRAGMTDPSALEGGWSRQTRGRSILLGIEQGF